MSEVEFDDILQQAERLTADLDGGNDLPRVQRNFQQIVDAGQRLCSGTPAAYDNAQVKASLLLSSQGYEIPAISDRLKTLTSAAQTLEPLEPVCDTDIEGFLRNERENAILAVLEEQKSKTFEQVEKSYWQSRLSEWEKEKQNILGKLIGNEGVLNFTQDFSDASRTDYVDYSTGPGVRSVMDAWEVGYARQVYIYNEKILSGSIRPDFVEICKTAAEKMKEESVISIWNMMKYILDAHFSMQDKSVLARRTSKSVIQSIISQARAFLEDNYKDYMLKCIQQRPHTAQLGGRLGTVNLVKSFLKVKPSHELQSYDGSDWAVLYYCIRCGDLDAALEVARSLDRNHSELSTWLSEYARDRTLSRSSEHKLQLYYKRSIRNGGNPFAIAVFCVIGRCSEISEAHSEVADKTEDYLWIKLSQVIVTEDNTAPPDALTLLKLQTLLADYGESHFNASANPLLYFQVLFLTYQFEAAIEFLSRFPNLRCHALHVALALHESNLLIKANSLHDSLLSAMASDHCQLTNIQRLNLPRLLMLYTRKFELTDPREALNYLYFLHKEKHENQSLFLQCTSELVRETGEFSMLLGGLNSDGSRRQGLVDKFCGENTLELIAKVAHDTESKGLFEDAIQLHDLCGNYDNVLSLLNRLLSPLVSASDGSHSDRVRIKGIAVNLAQRYRSLAVDVSRDLRSTFYIILDLLTFFDMYHIGKFDAALDVINKLHILPTSQDQVQEKITSFSSYSEEVRRSIGEILLATMNLLAMHIRSLPLAKSDEATNARSYARAILTFAGMLPYQLPADHVTKIAFLESYKSNEINLHDQSFMDISKFTEDQAKNCKIISKFPDKLKNESCMLGIDEAGRGPVLGPMVYAACVCPISCKDQLKDLGCDDSKALKEEKRDELFAKLDECTDNFVGWIVNILSPSYISTSMLSRTKYNLNSISHDTAIDLIKTVQKMGIEVKEVYVDTVGSPTKYQSKLKERFPTIDVTVESKADATYPIVSAASICAKVCRDKTVKTWKFDSDTESDYGSGYPSDPSTKSWLRKNIDPVFGFPNFVRFSWSTARDILENEAVMVKWPDEDEEAEGDKVTNTPAITSFFGANDSKNSHSRHPFFSANNLHIVSDF